MRCDTRSTTTETTPSTQDRLLGIVRAWPVAKAQLALLGDKHFLFNDTQSAFVMFGIHGRSWIALGDPVGPPDQAPALIRHFRDVCFQHGARPVIHEATKHYLPHYQAAGFRALRVAEEGRVQLASFSLAGRKRHNLRNALRNAGKDGRNFAWISSIAERPHLLPELRAVSHTWLGGKPNREKRFALGCFDIDYLCGVDFSVGLIHQRGRILGFVTAWAGHGRQELYLDLMRCRPDAPRATMDLLFVRVLQQAQHDGYTWFNVGMSPLPSAHDTPGGWGLRTRVYAAARRCAENFYNVEGLRQYKEKFGPEWSDRYLITQSTPDLLPALADVAMLTSGGLRGVLGRVPQQLAADHLRRLLHRLGRNR